MKDNAICKLLGIRYPILAGGMTWVSEAVLAAAMSEAGGLGCIATGNMPGDLLREEIQKYRRLSSKPFAVNLILLSPNFKDCVEVVKQERVPVLTLGAGNASPFIPELKAAGVTVVPVVNSVALARRLERSGADAIVAEGEESGGHVGETSTMPLVPQMVDALKIPVVAAGGIADGRGMAAAFALGASGIQVGTAIVVADESRAHANYKDAIIKANDRSTAVTGRSISKPVRALKNMLTQEFLYPTGQALQPVVELWILRMLVALSGHQRFLNRHGYSNDDLAMSMGLQASPSCDPEFEELTAADSDYEAIKAALKEQVTEKKKEELFDSIVKELRDKAKITTNAENLKAVSFTQPLQQPGAPAAK